MRIQVRKELQDCLLQEFESRPAAFKLCSGDGDVWRSNKFLWAWNIARGLTFFILVDLVDSEDKFNVEIAWSEDGKFPWGELGLRIKAEKAKGRERLGALVSNSRPDFVWAVVRSLTYEETSASIRAKGCGDHKEADGIHKLVEVPIEEAVSRVAPLVKDAVQKLTDYGLPFFRRVAEHRGLA